MKRIRTSEIRNFVKATGEEGVVMVLEQMAERLSAAEQTVQECGLQMLAMTKALHEIASGAVGLRSEIERMQGGGQDDDDDLPMAQ